MATERIGVALPGSASVPDDEFAQSVESLGYESVWVGENWGANVFLRLAEMVDATTEIDVGTAIANVYSRSPATLAMTAANLEEASDGRFRLGVGPSSPALVENLHGVAFERPVRRTHETVELVRAFTEGEGRVEYDGDLFEVSGFPSLEASFPIYNAAVGEANRRATGRLCDGWLPHLIPRSRLPESLETITKAARDVGRDPDRMTVTPYVPAVVDEDAEHARETVSNHVAFYVGNSGSFRQAVAAAFPEATDVVATRWNEGNRGAAAAAVTEAMLEELCVYGAAEEARERLRPFLEADVVDVPLLSIPEGVDAEAIDRTVEALAPTAL